MNSASSRNLTGKEGATYIVDEVFAYNSARLKEACQLFATACSIRMSPLA
jgi:hypothetical protein